jgi:hypothetical protein
MVSGLADTRTAENESPEVILTVEEESTPIRLSREDLYELAWSKPISELAKDFGISDVGLAKRCKRLGIPLPGRGYWARVDAGQTPYRPKLPKREQKRSDQSALTVGPSQLTPVPATVATLATARPESQDPNAVSARIATIALEATPTILKALAPVKRTALQKKYARRSDLTFDRGERSGPTIPMAVTEGSLDRALLLADRLLRSAALLGWNFAESVILKKKAEEEAERIKSQYGRHAPPEPPKPEFLEGRLWVEGEEIAFRIEEKLREEPRAPTAAELAREKREWGYHAPRKVSVTTGHLRVARLDGEYRYRGPQRHSWYDRKGKLVEDQIKDILLGFHELALLEKDRRAKGEQAARERAEAKRLEEERSARQEGNAKLIKQLETDAGAWHRARYLRRYIRAARRRVAPSTIEARYLNTTLDYLAWAERYVDQLDPLSTSPRLEDFERPTNEYGVMLTSGRRASRACWARLGKTPGRSARTTRRRPKTRTTIGIPLERSPCSRWVRVPRSTRRMIRSSWRISVGRSGPGIRARGRQPPKGVPC